MSIQLQVVFLKMRNRKPVFYSYRLTFSKYFETYNRLMAHINTAVISVSGKTLS